MKSADRDCPICGGPMQATHTARVLGRHDVTYFMCAGCQFWTTEAPWWLHEAYTTAISSLDTGIARRTIASHRVLFPVLSRLFPGGSRFVDWAGGPGLLVRLMRDTGLDFYWQDAYAANVFAAGFDWKFEDSPAAAVTAIEVFEHVVDPVAFVQEVLDATGTDTIVFTQELHHGADSTWWYLVPETGQHIAFYNGKSLRALAARFDMAFISAGWIHMLTRRRISETRFAREIKLAKYRFPAMSRRAACLIDDDFKRAVIRVRTGHW